MTVAEIEPRSLQPTAGKPGRRHSTRPPWVEAVLADWRARWPAAFTRPVPLAIGISGHMKAVFRAEGRAIDRKSMGMTLHQWTMQSAYLRAVVRGEMRRNLDGSEAGFPDDAARQYAQKLLDERAARHAEKERLAQERKSALSKPV